MRGSTGVESLTQRFVVQELLKYYEYWKGDDFYQWKIRQSWEKGQQDLESPYRGAYREALRQCQ